MVCCGASFSITAMSPNCRSASTRHTGRSERIASTTARFTAMTDLPEPPFVENTVTTVPRSPPPSSKLNGVDAVGVVGAAFNVLATRSTASKSCSELIGAVSTSLTPARNACCSSAVESSLATRIAPTSP